MTTCPTCREPARASDAGPVCDNTACPDPWQASDGYPFSRITGRAS